MLLDGFMQQPKSLMQEQTIQNTFALCASSLELTMQVTSCPYVQLEKYVHRHRLEFELVLNPTECINMA